MSKPPLLDTVVQLYSLERQGVSVIYTQGGLLLTATVIVAAALFNTATAARLSPDAITLARDALLLLSFVNVVLIAFTIWYIALGILPKTKYPRNRINQIITRLQNGEKDEVRDTSAMLALERLLAEAAEIYQEVNEVRSVCIKSAFQFLLLSVIALGACNLVVWFNAVYGG